MSTSRIHRRNFNITGQAHELTFSCYHGYQFLKSDRTCTWLAESINNARGECDFDLWAYVFMPEHVHLIIHPHQNDYDMSDIRTAIKKPTSKRALAWLRETHPEWMSRLTRSRGRRTETMFWQSGGGYDRNVTSSSALLAMIDYIHLSPVRRGLVARADDWTWSSAAHFTVERNYV